MIINYAEQAFDIHLRSIANGKNLSKVLLPIKNEPI
jgi:hypothetical protein